MFQSVILYRVALACSQLFLCDPGMLAPSRGLGPLSGSFVPWYPVVRLLRRTLEQSNHGLSLGEVIYDDGRSLYLKTPDYGTRSDICGTHWEMRRCGSQLQSSLNQGTYDLRIPQVAQDPPGQETGQESLPRYWPRARNDAVPGNHASMGCRLADGSDSNDFAPAAI